MTGFYMKAPPAINGLSICSVNSQALNNNIIEKGYFYGFTNALFSSAKTKSKT